MPLMRGLPEAIQGKRVRLIIILESWPQVRVYIPNIEYGVFKLYGVATRSRSNRPVQTHGPLNLSYFFFFRSFAPDIPGEVISIGFKIISKSFSVRILSLRISSRTGLPVSMASLAIFAAFL